MYILTTNLKSVSSMKRHRDLGITQPTPWHLAHRFRKAWQAEEAESSGPIEVHEAFVGGLEPNKHANKRLPQGRGTIGKAAVASAKECDTGHGGAASVPGTGTAGLQGFVVGRTQPSAQVYAGDHAADKGIPRPQQVVRHAVKEYVRGQAHAIGMESLWALLKRGYDGAVHHLCPTHLDRCAAEFEGRRIRRSPDTRDRMRGLVRGMAGKRRPYRELDG